MHGGVLMYLGFRQRFCVRRPKCRLLTRDHLPVQRLRLLRLALVLEKESQVALGRCLLYTSDAADE